MTRYEGKKSDQRLRRVLRSRAGKYLFLGMLLSLNFGTPGAFVASAADAPVPSESQVKAAFILNFPKYVDWPENTFPATNSPILIGIIGNDDISSEFAKMSRGKTVNGRPIEFKPLSTPADCEQPCHILFVGDGMARETVNILQRLRGRSVLTVGEDEQFIDRGGMINLARRNQKIRLQVSLEAAQEANLKISSKLMSVADPVKAKRK